MNKLKLTRSGATLLVALAVILAVGLQAQSRRGARSERNRGAAVVTMVDGDIRARDGDFSYRRASAARRDGMDDWSAHRDKILRRGEGRARPYRGRLYAYGGYPYHFGLGYWGYPYRHFGFGVRTVFVGGRRGFGHRRGGGRRGRR